MKNSLNNKILKIIEENNYKPKSRIFFVLTESFIWFGTFLSLIFASLSAGSFIFQILNKNIIPKNVNLIFILIRLFFIALFVILFIYQIKRTETGYRRNLRIYLISAILFISTAGSFLFIYNIGGVIDYNIGNYGIYSQAKKFWSDPGKTGLLAGELVEVSDNGYLVFKSLDGTIHIIDPSSLSYDEYSLYLEFLYVKMIGYEDNDIYYPCTVSPWRIRNFSGGINSEYKRKLSDNNLNFLEENVDINLNNLKRFKYFFERKNDVVRNKECR